MRKLFCVLLLGVLSGCAGESIPPDNLSGVQKPDERIGEEELQVFLRIVKRIPGGEPPTFTPLTDSFYFNDSAERLIGECRLRFERQFDVARQGKIWKQNRGIRRAAAQEKHSTTELAGIMTTLSTAICRSQFDDPEELVRLQQRGEQEIDRIRENIDRIDRVPARQMTSDLSRQRTELAMQLSRTVALVRYLELLTRVPEENVALVKNYQKQLTSLVDQSALDNLNPKALMATFESGNETARR